MRLAFLVFLMLNVSCASLSQMVKNMAGTSPKVKTSAEKKRAKPKTSYNNNQQYQAQTVPNRRYGRMDRNRFESEAKVGEGAGSLWVNEGQSSYLFSQNQKRLEGDVLNVLLEDQAKSQLDNKVSTIARLLKERKEAIEKRREARRKRKQASTSSEAEKQKEEKEPSNDKQQAQKGKAEENKLDVNKVPSRVVATYPDGSYRVKGTRTIIIENKEFQVMVSGLVRGNDIKDDSVASSKLLDSNFDITKSRRTQ